MSYTPTSWVSGTTPVDAPEMNNIESIYAEATQSFEQDLFTPFVHSGLVATKDGTTASQLDVTAGIAFLLQASDNTLRRRAPTASTKSTSGHPSTTMYLDLNADGTWSWATTHSGVANYLSIASVTTDASSNILAVTDARNQTTSMFPALTGSIIVTGRFHGDGHLIIPRTTTNAAGPYLDFDVDTTNHRIIMYPTTNGTDTNAYGWTFASRAASNGALTTAITISPTGTTALDNGLLFTDGAGNLTGPAGGGIPVTRNNVAGSVPIYTGTTTPSSPPTGSIWAKA